MPSESGGMNSEVLQWANIYTDLGWALCLIPPGQKGPSGLDSKGWNRPENAIVGTVESLPPEHGLGLLHSVSGTCALDIDDVECWGLILAEFGLDPEGLLEGAPRIVGRPGHDKALFRLPPEAGELTAKKLVWPPRQEGGKPVTVVEFRGGPVQDVLPPTIHPDTGQPYAWAPGTAANITTLPTLPAPLLHLWQHWDQFKDQLQALCPWAPPPAPPAATARRPYSGGSDADFIGRFNREHSVESLLLQAGYRKKGKRFLAPTSSSGLPGVSIIDEGRACYSHHASCPLNDGHKHDAFDLFQTFQHGGNFEAAIRAAAEMYGEPMPNFPEIDISAIVNQGAAPASPGELPAAAEPELKFPLSLVDTSEITEIDWVVEDYFEADSLSLMFGEPGCGKSLVAIDLACSVATGKPWHGHEVKQGLVIYIAGEGFNGLARRFRAWETHHGISLKGAPLYRSHRPARLYDRQAAIDVAESVYAVAKHRGVMPSLIVIDTVARNMGGDENSTQDMNQFIEHLDVCLRAPYRSAVLCVHHSGKASPGQARGSSALRGAIDAEYQVEKGDGSPVVLFSNRKMKDAEVPPDKQFTIETIGLGVQSRKGLEITSAALSTVDISGLMAQVNGAGEYLGKNQQRALVVLEGLMAQRRREGVQAPITQDEWREACAGQGIKRNRFAEAVRALEGKERIAIDFDGTVRAIYNQQAPEE